MGTFGMPRGRLDFGDPPPLFSFGDPPPNIPSTRKGCPFDLLPLGSANPFSSRFDDAPLHFGDPPPRFSFGDPPPNKPSVRKGYPFDLLPQSLESVRFSDWHKVNDAERYLSDCSHNNVLDN